MQKNLKKYAILFLIIAITALLALDVSDNNPLPTVKELQTNHIKSATGAYLAGQYAAKKSNYSKASKFFLESIEHNKNNKALDENVLDLLIATGKYDEALELAEKIASDAESSNTINANLLLIAKSLRDEDFTQASKTLATTSDATKKSPIFALLKSWIELGLGNKETAFKDVSGINTDGYFNNVTSFNQALIAEITGNNKLASERYKALLGKNKPTKIIAQNAYRFFKNSGDLESAKLLFAVVNEGIDLKNLQNIPTAKQASAELLSDVAGISLLQQNFAQASLFYRLSLFIEPESEETILLLGAILAHEQDFAASNELFTSIPEDSENYNAAKMASTQNLIKMENDLAASKILKELLQVPESKVEAAVSLGDIARGDEDFSAANEYYSSAIEDSLDQENQHVFWPIYFARGVTFERLQEWESAEADFQKALELKPKQPDVLNYLAYSILDMNFEARFEEALSMLEIAYDQRPNDPHIIDSIGWAWFKMGDYKKAAKHLERAAGRMPYDPTINDHLGDVYWKSGRKNEAFFAWERALDNKPEERFVEQLKDKLANGIAEDAPAQEAVEEVEKDENIDQSAS